MRSAEVKESVLMAMNAIAAHKLRSALTLLGVLVGVFSIVVVMTAMRALQSNIERELSQLGSDTFGVQKSPPVYFGGPEGFEAFWRRKNILYSHGLQVIEKATLAVNVGLESGFWSGEATTRYAKSNPTVELTGVTAGSFPAKNWVIEEGRAISDLDVSAAREVCVLGNSLSQQIFPFGGAVGETVKFDGINYVVIGVLESKGGALGGNQDNFLAVPITNGLNRYGRLRSVTVLVQTAGRAQYDDTVEQVKGILRTIRKVPPGNPEDFEIFSNDSLVKQFQTFTLSVRIGAAVVSSIALVAAGIGIMNIMLVSVTERTREIGIRRAIGAKKRSIMTQFITEAIVLCQVGGIIGIILGVITGNVAAYALKVPIVIPIDWVVLGLVICSVVGVTFGSYPAVKAANLDPIESLRYE